jgi:hypothetical protein
MNSRHLQGEEQERAQKAQVVRLPETFGDPDGTYAQAYRSASFAIYLRSEPAGSQQQHKFFAWMIRVVGGVEMLGDPITNSASLDACINLAAKWEQSQ